ncbi:hypothetical protein [Paenibacillus aestuarii]|uniref:Pilus assembly protein n=1 Tax=Paenibacillus aestuarii TaxID=516965 RepID=A0ABW0KJZ0_9BACL|nr:hypothetical protein [Paenibacillus aestuarii]
MEASLIFPAILVCTITLLFIGMYVYQKVYVEQMARTTAERLAYTWDNSHKDVVTGHFNPKERDGLYWRLAQDSMSDLFGMLFTKGSTEVNVPSAGSEGMGLVESKLARSREILPSGINGVVRYSNYLLVRKIEVNLHKPFLFPTFALKLFDSGVTTGQSIAYVVDPVELIRITDITRTYMKEIKGRITAQEAKAALKEPAQGLSGEGVKITSERQAAAYLKSLVGGKEVVFSTPSGKSRTIDALDAQGIAHQAYYSVMESQLRNDQMLKDVELLEQGTQVKGVVWHFFKKGTNQKEVPSANFRKELERKGIVVVIHN